jgi:potassium efflux system protein
MKRWLGLILLLSMPLLAQPLPTPTTIESPTATPTPTPTAVVTVSATPLALSDLASQLEEAKTLLAEMQVRLHGSDTESQLLQDVDPLGPDVEREVSNTLKALGKNPSMPELRDLESVWETHQSDLQAASDRLAALDGQRAAEQLSLDEQGKIWAATAANEPAEIPAELQESMAEVRASISELRKKEYDARGRILLSQAQVARAQSRVKNMLDTVRQARESKVQRVFVRDGLPFWRFRPGDLFNSNWVGALAVSLESDKDDLFLFAAANVEHFFLHGLFFLLLLGGLRWAHGKVTVWAEQEPVLSRTVGILSAPISTALLLTVFLTPWFYTRAPILVVVGLAALALVPATMVLRRLLDSSLYPLLNALILLFCCDQVRQLSISQSHFSRVLFVLEMAGSLLFLGWLRRQTRIVGHQRLRAICLLLTAVFSVALLGNLLGYLELSYWLGDGAIVSAYLGVFLYASLEVVSGLTLFSLRVPPLSLLASVRQNRHRFRSSLVRLVRILAVLLWLALTLESMAVLSPVSDAINGLMKGHIVLGALNFTLGGLLSAVLVLWLTGRISRVSQYVLELDVFPRFQLERGVDYTLSTLMRYAILVFGVLFGLAAIGVDTTKFTIVAGALGVGIGFGLQNIVNNFVSGIILLFERPIKVGDLIQVNDQVGLLKQVGLRASVMRTTEGAEVIVPNGQLLSTQVTNWTLSDPLRRLAINIGVAYGNKPREVMALLLEAASRCSDVLPEPKPSVLFVGLGESSLDFRVQVWTQRSQTYPVLQSDLLLRLYEALEEANIEIPFPHRTITVDNWPKPSETSAE